MSTEAEALVPLLRSAVVAQRLGMLARGGELLARLVDRLAQELARDPGRAVRLAGVLAALVAAQERGDPIGLADRLEFELLPLLEPGRSTEQGA